MDDRIEGGVKQATGKAKEEWGDLTDNTGTELEGKVDQGEGKLQSSWGEARDEVRDEDDNR
jgi:uncharacterized protein YjbJ (UPF0337 family)